MKQILYLSLIFLIFSCKKTNKDQVEVIDISGSISKKEKLNLSDIATEVKYIPLESSEQSWITQVTKIRITPKNIFVFDRSQNLLFQFDLSGRFKRRIGVQGRGPHEYGKMGDFDVLSPSEGGKETIGIIDYATENIIFFDEQGNFISSFKPAAGAIGMAFLEDGTVAAFPHRALISELNEGYSLNFYSREGKLLSRARTTENLYEGNNPAYSGSFRKFKTELQYYEPYERSIYKINPSGEVKRKYVFDLGSNALPLKEIIITDMTDKAFGLGNIIEAEDYIFAEFLYQHHLVAAFYSKSRKEASNVIFNFELIDHAFHNDIDGGMPFWPSAISYDGKWVSSFYPVDAQRILNDPYFDSFAIQDEERRKNLLQLIDQLEEKGNPIIQLTTPK